MKWQTWGAKYAAKDVFCRLLQPMPNGVLEHLVPNDRSRADWVNATTGSAGLHVLFQSVRQQSHSIRLEVHISVQSQNKRVFRLNINKNLHCQQTSVIYQTIHSWILEKEKREEAVRKLRRL